MWKKWQTQTVSCLTSSYPCLLLLLWPNDIVQSPAPNTHNVTAKKQKHVLCCLWPVDIMKRLCWTRRPRKRALQRLVVFCVVKKSMGFLLSPVTKKDPEGPSGPLGLEQLRRPELGVEMRFGLAWQAGWSLVPRAVQVCRLGSTAERTFCQRSIWKCLFTLWRVCPRQFSPDQTSVDEAYERFCGEHLAERRIKGAHEKSI